MKNQKNVTIEPVTRVEGEGKINILLDENGNVENAFFQVLDYRAFEKFLVGREGEEIPRIASRICGVCSWAHHMASAKALDNLFGREITPTAAKIRELLYNAHTIHSHILHVFFLASPDFFLLPDATPSIRNLVGIITKYPELGRKAIKWHTEAEKIQKLIGGRAVHTPLAIPGGVSKGVTENEKEKIENATKGMLEFSLDAIDLFKKKVVENEQFHNLFLGERYKVETYYMGIIDEKDKMNLYDGKLRIIDPTGKEYKTFEFNEYSQHIAEKVVPWSYTKFPYLKGVGWKGLEGGIDSGVFRVNALPRLNITEGMPTPLAQEAYNEYIEFYGKPVHATLGYHWARLVELIYCCERMLELLSDKDILGRELANYEGEFKGEGVGVVEAPRGTLIHHYKADDNAIITESNLIIPTTMNNAAICKEIRDTARELIHNGEVSQGLLNQVEMAFRAYDPCLSCSTHTLPGKMPLEIDLISHNGEVVKRLRRNIL
jgi:F420-non-reducing hydrogenase large subunit